MFVLKTTLWSLGAGKSLAARLMGSPHLEAVEREAADLERQGDSFDVAIAR